MSQGDANSQGWIKLHRKLLKNPIVQKSQYWHLWTYLLLRACHEKTEFIWNGKLVVLKPGQLLTGREELSRNIKIPPSTIEKILKYLKTEHQIEQQTTNKFRIITIKNWELYQATENIGKQKGQQRDNSVTTEEQQRDTYKKEEEGIRRKKKEGGDPRLHQIFDHWNSYKGKSVKKRNKESRQIEVVWKSHKIGPDGKISPDVEKAITETLKDGHLVENIKEAIDNYAKILIGADYWWTHIWPLSTFLLVKYERNKDAEHKWWQFLSDNFDENKYLTESAKQKRERQAKGPAPVELAKKQIEQKRCKTNEQKTA